HHARVRAHVAVAGLGIDLHVVRDAELVEQPAEATALRREHAIAAAVAAEDGADAYEVAAGRGHVAVENRGDAEPRADRVEEREPAAQAESGDAEPARVDLGPVGEPRPGGVEILERRPRPTPEREHRPDDAEEARPAGVEQVRG